MELWNMCMAKLSLVGKFQELHPILMHTTLLIMAYVTVRQSAPRHIIHCKMSDYGCDYVTIERIM